jgi:elongator complex protein 3
MLDALNGKNRIENKTSDGNDAGDLAETKKENKKVSETAGKKVAGIKTKKEELTENAVEAALEENEKATHRMVGLTIETRPDCASEKEVYGLVKLGTTRIELGVQTLSDGKYILARRGHGRKEVIEATRNCKDALLKVCYHMMPGLFSTPEEDGGYFGELFSNPDFRPDMLKIYPTLVMPGTGLYDLWKKGKFEPPTEEDTTRLLMKIKKNVPDYVRIMRVERDIPSNLIGEGIRTPNIRQIVRERMRRQGEKCRCIRCREIGYKTRREGVKPDFTAVEMERKDYGASGGKEIFLSMVDKTNDALMGICRLRKPSIERFVGEIGDNCGVRELHVYGDELDLGLRKAEAAQHRGFGKTLLSEAERIAKEGYDSKKLVVISGAGARPYYYKLGYARDGAYVSKTL